MLLQQISKILEAALELGNRQGMEEYGGAAAKSLHCHEWTFKGNPGETSEQKESYREVLNLLEKA